MCAAASRDSAERDADLRKAGLELTTAIRRSDFGITGGVLVGDDVIVTIEVLDGVGQALSLSRSRTSCPGQPESLSAGQAESLSYTTAMPGAASRTSRRRR